MAQLKTILLRKLEGTRAMLFEAMRNLNGVGSSLALGSESIPDIDNAEVFQKIASANVDVQKAKEKVEAVMRELSGKKGVPV